MLPAPHDPAATGSRWSASATSAARRWPTWCCSDTLADAGLGDRSRSPAPAPAGGTSATRWTTGPRPPPRRRLRPEPATAPSSTTPAGTRPRPGAGDGRAPTCADVGGGGERGRGCSATSTRSSRGGEVPDPYYGGPAGFEEVLRMVERTARRSWPHCSAGSWPERPPMTRLPLVARRAEELLGAVGGRHGARRRRRHLDRHPAAAQRRHHRPDQDATTRRPTGFFDAEVRGLRWLGEADRAGGVAVPEVLAARPRVPDPALDRAGQDHRRRRRRVRPRRSRAPTRPGADGVRRASSDGFIGRLPLPNRTAPTWAEFYATRRVLPYLKLARDRGAATRRGRGRRSSRVVGRLPALLPDEPPARLHGDLWNGNVLWGLDGTSA